MDLVNSPSPYKNFCYIRCNFCNTVLAVSIPFTRSVDTLTLKCGHCSNLTFLSSRPPIHVLVVRRKPFDFVKKQRFCSDFEKGQSSTSCITTTDAEPLSPRALFVVKPPEKKHHRPSAYK